MEKLLDIEKKLELTRQVRSRYDRDKNDLAKREWLLYGKASTDANTPYAADDIPPDEELPFSSFKLRLLFSAGLFLLLIICDISGKPFFGMPAEQCFQTISQDYESSISQWVNAASHGDVKFAVPASQTQPAQQIDD